MRIKRKQITVFEHQTIKLGQEFDGIIFDESKLEALQKYYGKTGVPFFSLIHKGIRFKEYVGVIQVGGTLIEVLPKADKTEDSKIEEKKWRNILIGMLRTVGSFEIKSTSDSHLKIKSNTVLDLYFELFINEVSYLLHSGLVKQYRKKESNETVLKGNIQFSKHIQQNLVHQERFYVHNSTYDVEHKLHIILYKAICLIKQINTNALLHSHIGALLLDFPEMPDLKISEATFSNIVFNRKTLAYKKAIEISKLILLQYHPDLISGRNHVLALMFDMNKLWEQFVYVSLRKALKGNAIVTAQTSKNFWKPEFGYKSQMRPDIWVRIGNENLILDTKWKNLNGFNPSPEDLRQMYVYHEYFNAKKVAMVYPGNETKDIKGTYFPTPNNDIVNKECSLISLAIPEYSVNGSNIVKALQDSIKTKFEAWIYQ